MGQEFIKSSSLKIDCGHKNERKISLTSNAEVVLYYNRFQINQILNGGDGGNRTKSSQPGLHVKKN